MTPKLGDSFPFKETSVVATEYSHCHLVALDDIVNDEHETQNAKRKSTEHKNTHTAQSPRIWSKIASKHVIFTQTRSALGRVTFGLAVAALLVVIFTFFTSVSSEMQVNTESSISTQLGTTKDVWSKQNTSTASLKPSHQVEPADAQTTDSGGTTTPQPLLRVSGEFRLNTVQQPNNRLCQTPVLKRPVCDAETGCSSTLFENSLPHFHSLGGKEEDLGPAARQWFAALQAPASYLIRGSEPFAINFTVEQPVLGDGGEVVKFKIHETHTVVANDNVKRRPVGGELGGSSYRAHVITRSVGEDTNVTELVTLCKIEDHFNGSYTVYCPVAASVAVLFRYSVKNVTVSTNVHLDYTHFNGFETQPVRSIDLTNPNDMVIKTSKLYNFPVLTDAFLVNIERPDNWNGDDVLRPCTQNEASAAGDFGGTWIKWKGDQGTGPTQNLTYVPASVCSLTDWDTAGGNFVTKNKPLRARLRRCLQRNDRSFLLAGASHARFSFDEIADRIGVRDQNIELHHPDHTYFNEHLIHQHCTFFDQVIGRMDDPINQIRAGTIPRGFRQGDVFLLQTGAWDLAPLHKHGREYSSVGHCDGKIGPVVEFYKCDGYSFELPSLFVERIEHRWYRRNPTLQAVAEIQKAYVAKIGHSIKFLDFFTMALPKADLSVCIDHYVCPRNSQPGLLHYNPFDVTMGVVGKRVVDALLDGVCGPTRRH